MFGFPPPGQVKITWVREPSDRESIYTRSWLWGVVTGFGSVLGITVLIYLLTQ